VERSDRQKGRRRDAGLQAEMRRPSRNTAGTVRTPLRPPCPAEHGVVAERQSPQDVTRLPRSKASTRKISASAYSWNDGQ